MDSERELRFYKLYEQLASLTQISNDKPDITRIEKILNEIAAMFRLSKGVTNFYRGPVGETMISYDTGEEGVPVHTVRCVNKLMSITTMTVYMTDKVETLTEEEMFKVDLTMRTVAIYVCRNRLQVMAEQLAFYDDMGFSYF